MMAQPLTPYPDVNEILSLFASGLTELLGKQLVGIYLTGSLTYGDFNPNSSDIDFLVVLSIELSDEKLSSIETLHKNIGSKYPAWAQCLEGSYITTSMLKSSARPEIKRPYVNGGKIWQFRYGNEWIINLYALQECGIAICGPEPKSIFPKVTIEDVRQASKKDLVDDWEPKLADPDAFRSPDYDSGHLRNYAVLTMCRILHRAQNNEMASKKVASAWVKSTYGDKWIKLIEEAENWEHGKPMSNDSEVKDFIRFTLNEVT
ncbi:MAG TPA: aminoglycoside adenylyltransferase domain-containing protein [Candidatus Saccharimonadales bacterium]